MVVAQIKDVQDHPNADKLYLLKVDVGDEERQLVAGIRTSYSKEELLNRQAIVVSNIEPATIRGEESQGMLLAVSDEEGISVISPDRDMKLGSLVR